MDLSFLKSLGLEAGHSGAFDGSWLPTSAGEAIVRTPITNEPIGSVRLASVADYRRVSAAAHQAFLRWREVPAPARGDLVRRIGNALREHKEALGRLVALETGKILEEGRGEIQEAIDIADWAVGLSRQLCGLTMKSERRQHQMRESWHPLGTVGVITAFNFPAAVWAWNSMLALVCGDAVLWKPSHRTPLTALAMTRVVAGVLAPEGFSALVGLVLGADEAVGKELVDDPSVPLISATGSTRMGRVVGQRVAARLGRTILELGGNNAVAVLDDADLDLAVRAIVFGAVGTAGQRCTSTRRVLAQERILPELERRLLAAYAQVKVGDPLQPETLMGPLIDAGAVGQMLAALDQARAQGGFVLCGGQRLVLAGALRGGHYVEPTIVRARRGMPIVAEETFAPILYLIPVKDVADAIAANNEVPQGLSSAIFTQNVRHAERFLSEVGSDCGIANVNLGTSGAEIGGAFGGEKETGGGRESGSDSWKAYMRRQTSTVNWGNELPLAQGIRFEL
jgi:aldehyde dehydrogenase (NAD+)